MPMTHVLAAPDHEAYKLMEEILPKQHDHLKETNIRILLRTGNNWQSKGREVLGRAKILPDDVRRAFATDAFIVLNQYQWDEVLNEQQKRYLIDHELTHLDVAYDGEDVKYLDDGRPKLTLRVHDVEDFSDVIQRHGLIMEDTKRLVKAMASAEQMSMDEYLGDDEQSKNVIQGRFGAQIAELEAGKKQAAATAAPN